MDDVWQPHGNYIQFRGTVYMEGERPYTSLKESCRAFPLSENMNYPEVISQAKQWLKNCLSKSSSHGRCTSPSTTSFKPARLLDVSGDSLRLVLESQVVKQEPYCTLSYCWGSSEHVKLTAFNEEDLNQGVELDALPGTIQDAIRVAQGLGIKYIWIDSLCIVQTGDNGQDWTYHSTKMSEIYAHSILNISADRASAANEGFLGQRSWPAIRPIFNDGDVGLPSMQKKSVITFDNVTDMALATEPLGSRAWVLSERMLSPRILHFGAGEMFWGCSSCLASESCPEGFSGNPRNFTYANFELSNSSEANVVVEDWIQILTSYSHLSLTMPKLDKLVALAGMGRLYENRTKKTLVAGILKDTLPHSLLWERNQFSSITKRSQTYRAPSWSWASFDGPLQFYWSRDFWGQAKSVANVLEVWTKPVEGHDHLGQIEDGAITIRGPEITLADFENLADRESLNQRHNLHWDQPEDQKLQNITSIIFLMVGWNERADNVQGLLVIPGIKDNTWVRVGSMSIYFSHETKIHEPSDISPKCQKFVDDRDTETFTIV